MKIEDVKDILSQKFDEPDVTSLVNVLQACRRNPDEVSQMFNVCLTRFTPDRIKIDLSVFHASWDKAANLLGDTPEGQTFKNLCKLTVDIVKTLPATLN
jgi:hypothetical protein